MIVYVTRLLVNGVELAFRSDRVSLKFILVVIRLSTEPC